MQLPAFVLVENAVREHSLDLVEEPAHVWVVRPVVETEPALEHLRFGLAHDSVGEDPLRESNELVNLPVRHGLRVARPPPCITVSHLLVSRPDSSERLRAAHLRLWSVRSPPSRPAPR